MPLNSIDKSNVETLTDQMQYELSKSKLLKSHLLLRRHCGLTSLCAIMHHEEIGCMLVDEAAEF